ncbi:MAG: sulfotransferase family protein [Minwuia sp.]|uniref:sulfotransferase family protein n=1 Tax=Minwuia sp. TaxID=2493630 RepID=UPI003A8BDA41
MKHPLSGADPATFFGALAANGGVAGGQALRTLGMAGAVIGRTPFSLAERLWCAARVPRNLPEPPVFIVGHWRSGTTHLYNIMSKGEFAFVPPLATGLPWDLLLIGGLFRPLLDRALPDSRAIDNVPVTPDAPQEDEIALANMTRQSFYHALYFPGRFQDHLRAGLFFEGVDDAGIAEWERQVRRLYAKLVHAQGGRRLLIKNPVYTGRVAHLARMFPGAKFINMVRDPYDIFVSMRNFYVKLLPELALQNYADVDIDRAVLTVFPELMQRLRADRAALAGGDFVELRYEELDAEPVDTVRRAYEALGLQGFETSVESFRAYLGGIRSYRKNEFRMPADVIELVNRHWADEIEALGYEVRVP